MSEEGTVENLSTIELPEPKVETKVETVEPVKTEPETPKTFTQEEMDRQIGRRLAREQAKYDRELRDERENRIRLEERLAAHQPKQEQAKDGPPQLNDYADFEEYLTAKAEYIADKRMEKSLSERQAQEREHSAKVTAQQTAQIWQKKIAAATKDLPDYEEVVSNSKAPLTPAMEAAIMDSESGPQLAYYLANHADEAQRIASLTPIQAVRALTLIEAGFKVNPVTKTPEPIKATGSRQTSSAKALTDVSDYDEFAKRRREFIAKRR